MTNQGLDEKMRLALVPPKPKEFVMAYMIASAPPMHDQIQSVVGIRRREIHSRRGDLI